MPGSCGSHTHNRLSFCIPFGLCSSSLSSINSRFGWGSHEGIGSSFYSQSTGTWPGGVCFFSNQWWGGGYGKRDCCSGRRGIDQPGQAPLSPALWVLGYLFSSHLCIPSSPGKSFWFLPLLRAGGGELRSCHRSVFCAFELQVSSRRRIFCIAGEKGEVGRHMGQRWCMSVPSLPPKNWSGLLLFESCCEAVLYPSEISTQKS